MKKAEEYLEEAKNITSNWADQEYDADELLKVIKKAQIDTAEYVIRRLTTTASKNESILNVIDEIKKEIL